MYRSLCLLFCILLLIPALVMAQPAHVYDAKTKQAIPFATIKFGDSGQGMVAGLDGSFELPAAVHAAFIEVSSLGYISAKLKLPLMHTDIRLQPGGNTLDEFTITPPYDKMRRILNSAIAAKGTNNPDKYDWYRCSMYYKMVVDISWPDSMLHDDSTVKGRRRRNLVDSQHLLLSETYSRRTWRRPQQLQEEVLASRLSGLKKSVFTSMATDVLPFHSYSDYLKLNGKDYHNPVSRGFEQYYRFNLVNELTEGRDTIWILSFRPRGLNENNLSGTVYINSDGYAISQMVAKTRDTVLQQTVRIEQQYGRIPMAGAHSRWFPQQLNYIIDWDQHSNTRIYTLHMKGNTLIDSVTWQEDKSFKFDKAHTIKLLPGADAVTDTGWRSIRPIALDAREQRTYKVIDSMGGDANADKILTHFEKIPEYKVTFGVFDMDVSRIINFNNYEHTRIGAGGQTNERLIKWLSIGGWAGYGFRDKEWKYGAFAEVYADRSREFAFRASYTDDIADPGRIQLNADLDKNYLRRFLLQRVDEAKTYSLSVRKKIAYWDFELGARRQQIIPRYNYALSYEGANHTSFIAREASLNFRYAYALRTAPFFSSYYNMGSSYPIVYGKVTTGWLQGSNSTNAIPYTQLLLAALWHKHINRIGTEHIMAEGGKSISNSTLPLSKLFAGNGFRYDSKALLSIYAFGGMMTMYPYEYYSDQFINLLYRHDFDWKLYKLEMAGSVLSSMPNICLQYNMLYGTLRHPEAQKYVAFSVPDRAYHEAGILLNNLVRLRSGNLYYLGLNIGYFYHIDPLPAAAGGRFVFGLGVQL